jgi:hypothetical protein
METLESSLPKPKLFCRLRKTLVAHTPEEEVRQSFLAYLLDQKKMPEGWIAIEVSLGSFVSSAIKPPSRRIDLLLFDGSDRGLRPLLLVECKAVALNKAAERQLLSYNLFVQAPYVCLVNQNECRFGTFTPDRGWVFSDKEPPPLLRP